jgi:hypothetical protein
MARAPNCAAWGGPGGGGHKGASVSTWDGEVVGPLHWQLTPCLPPVSAGS